MSSLEECNHDVVEERLPAPPTIPAPSFRPSGHTNAGAQYGNDMMSVGSHTTQDNADAMEISYDFPWPRVTSLEVDEDAMSYTLDVGVDAMSMMEIDDNTMPVVISGEVTLPHPVGQDIENVDTVVEASGNSDTGPTLMLNSALAPLNSSASSADDEEQQIGTSEDGFHEIDNFEVISVLSSDPGTAPPLTPVSALVSPTSEASNIDDEERRIRVVEDTMARLNGVIEAATNRLSALEEHLARNVRDLQD
ncbi:SubName: Full=Uncharacterized protein {ECO:0000313/EMBL:CCA74629.1} [Serendipita indica DSM 11827]|uniref:Uncharacterized protein n=1 Tax=Serendipita indica (strain DSM 11827) TaxID=1109443 RepID=G4TTI6_SERID|nr:SubName: Full=Uncharacterized protein {ECO:0000313/EMBL:CCA74629.1} [Serendipita indica DSM 11827]CCA74629.1 hypothetical protein PIIN_08581 [Serendipita indica DSM 11827]